jgi:hypothetical protein
MFRSNSTKRIAIIVVAVFATALIMGATLLSIDGAFATKKYNNWSDCREDHSKNWCKKYFKKHDNDNGNGGNKASQGIGQSQSSSQNSQCVSGGSTSGSCNNVSVQNQQNSGNNALVQR